MKMTAETGARAAMVVAVAGVIALVTILIFFAGVSMFGPLNDAALLVMTLAFAPVMATYYELGGRTPLRPAQASLAISIAAVVVWSATQALMIAGVIHFDYESAATGGFALEAVTVAIIGLWLAGASVLAAAWLPPLPRWVGAIAGAGTVVFGVGLLLGGVNHPLTYVGGVGYQVLLPAWAFLLYRRWRELAAA